MATVRRWYQYLVCFITLQAVVWAIIYLARDLLTVRQDISNELLALQISIIVVGFPLFLAHWLWAQRMALADDEERGSAVRRFYLYGSLAAFLGPWLNDAYYLIDTPLRAALGESLGYLGWSWGDDMVRNGVGLALLALFGGYQYRLLRQDQAIVAETEIVAIFRRFFLFAFSTVGFTLTMLGLIHLLRWLLYQLGGWGIGDPLPSLADEVARLVVGIPLWLFFWSWAQRLFASPDAGERRSTLRKLYLYGLIFVSVLATVGNATLLLAGLLRRLLELPSTGDIRGPLPVVLGMAIPWIYHTYILRQDEAEAGEAPRQAVVRRLYLYLVAAIGLVAFLGGLGGTIGVLLTALEESGFGTGTREAFAMFTAALVAGLPVWLLPWRQAQMAALLPGPVGAEERRSLVRKIYLYLFFFVATMVGLGATIGVVFRLVFAGLSRGERLAIAYPLAYALMAVGAWLYHGAALRGDNELARAEHREQLAALHVAVVDGGEGTFGQALLVALRQALPTLALLPVPLTPAAAQAMGAALPEEGQNPLAQAEVIVEPWDIAAPRSAGTTLSTTLAQALAGSPARRLLVPTWESGWEWAGVPYWNQRDLVEQTVRAIRQIAEGEAVHPERAMGPGTILLFALGAMLLFWVMAMLIGFVASSLLGPGL